MRVIITCVGSDGDLIPMLGVGKALQTQGHQVTVLCGEWQQKTASAYTLHSESILSTSQFAKFTENAAKGDNEWLAFFLEAVLPSTRPTYQYIANQLQESQSSHETELLLLGSCHALGLKLAQEKLGVRWLATHLQPAADDDPASEAQQFFNRLAGSKINIIRRALDLPPLTIPFGEWMMQCQQAVLFYPEWFCQYQHAQTLAYRHVGFPFTDDKSTASELPPELDLLLSQDTPPIVFTYGTGNTHAKAFFELAAHTCEKLGLPAIFLSKQRDMLPEKLPPQTLWLGFVPLGELMPYTHLIVHHGGIGTCAQAFKAGIPQIIMPVGFDQFQNAQSVERLLLGKQLTLANTNNEQLADHIQQLINSHQVEQACRKVAQTFNDKSAFDLAVEFITT